MEEEDDLICTAERKSPAALAGSQPATLTYENFDGKKTIIIIEIIFKNST